MHSQTCLSLCLSYDLCPMDLDENFIKYVIINITLTPTKLLFCNRIHIVKWLILSWSLSQLTEHAVQMGKAVKSCTDFFVWVADVLFSWCVLWRFSWTQNKQKKVKCYACSPFFSKVVLQLMAPVILERMRRGMHFLTSLASCNRGVIN